MFYNKVLEKMQNKYTELTGNNPDEASDIGIRLKVLAGEIENMYSDMEHIEQQIFPQTSSGDYLDMHAKMRGLTRKSGNYASGTLRFSREAPTNADLYVAKNTTVANSGDNPTYFKTTKAGVLIKGDTYVDIPAEALESGGGSNISAGKVTVIVNPVAGIRTVTNIIPFSGGTQAESDDELRQRIISSYASISNGTNAAYYYDLVAAHQGVSFTKVYPRNRGKGTVDIVICVSDTSNEEAILKELSTTVSTQREIGVSALVYTAEIVNADINVQISLNEGYSSSVVKEQCTLAITSYLNNLAIAQRLRLNHLGSKILDTQGVKDYKFVSPTQDLAVLGTQKIKSGNILVSIGDGYQ